MILCDYIKRQAEWSAKTFGTSQRTLGIVNHIRKELEEILRDPGDLEEWIDVMILALDGYWRHGGNPDEIYQRLQAKQNKNFERKWPFPPPPEDQASEHVR
jgi:hypothetical protein